MRRRPIILLVACVPLVIGADDYETRLARVAPAATAHLALLQREVAAMARPLGFVNPQDAYSDRRSDGGLSFVQLLGDHYTHSLGVTVLWYLDDGHSSFVNYVQQAMQWRPEPVPATYRIAGEPIIWRNDPRWKDDHLLCDAQLGMPITFRLTPPPGSPNDPYDVRARTWMPLLASRGRLVLTSSSHYQHAPEVDDRGRPTENRYVREETSVGGGMMARADPDEHGVVYWLSLRLKARRVCVVGRTKPLTGTFVVEPAELPRFGPGGTAPYTTDLLRMASLVVGARGDPDPLFADGLADGEWRLANVRIIGSDDRRLRESAARLQEFYQVIGQQLVAGQLDMARNNIAHCLDQAERLRADLASHREADPASTARVVIVGLPSDRAMLRRRNLLAMRTAWIDGATQINGDLQRITAQLSSTEQSLSANVVKSVLKNYLDWCNSLPSGSPEALLSTLGGAAAQVPWDLPRSLAGSEETSAHDAALLQNQTSTIARLREWQGFLEQRRSHMVAEARAIADALTASEAVPAIAADLRTRISGLAWATWVANPIVGE